MQGISRLIRVICMILILIFAIIHLGVSIGIITRFHRYGDVFRPETGLAAFNIVISIYAFFIGGFGLFSVLTNQEVFSKIVAFAAIALAFFTLVSLITALIINSLAMTYVNSRFLNHMNNYQTNQDSTNIIDRIQTNYDCCGSNTWLDWSEASLSTTQSSTIQSSTAQSSTAQSSTSATTTLVNTTITTEVVVTNGTTNTSSIDKIINDIEDFASVVENSIIERSVDSRSLRNTMETADTNLLSSEETTEDFNFEQNPSQQIIRRKRQTQSAYGGVYGLPSSFSIALPQSCCTTDLSTISTQSNSYCASSANSFHTNGCQRALGKHSVDQTIGLAVINSCLFVLALAAVALLIEANSGTNSPPNTLLNQPTEQYMQPSAAYSTAPAFSGTSINNYNPTYPQYS